MSGSKVGALPCRGVEVGLGIPQGAQGSLYGEVSLAGDQEVFCGEFGDDFAAAAFLGRPDRFEWTQGEYCELLYAAGGFQIDYDKGRFAYLAFFIGPDEFLPEHSALKFSEPRLLGGAIEGMQLTRDVDTPLLEHMFGPPDSVDTDSDETILYYTRQNITMEFEMDGKTGGLKRWNLYPK